MHPLTTPKPLCPSGSDRRRVAALAPGFATLKGLTRYMVTIEVVRSWALGVRWIGFVRLAACTIFGGALQRCAMGPRPSPPRNLTTGAFVGAVLLKSIALAQDAMNTPAPAAEAERVVVT